MAYPVEVAPLGGLLGPPCDRALLVDRLLTELRRRTVGGERLVTVERRERPKAVVVLADRMSP